MPTIFELAAAEEDAKADLEATQPAPGQTVFDMANQQQPGGQPQPPGIQPQPTAAAQQPTPPSMTPTQFAKNVGTSLMGATETMAEAGRRFAFGALRIPAGIIQMGLDSIDETIGPIGDNPLLATQFSDAFNDMVKATSVLSREDFVEVTGFDMFEIAGEILPSFALRAKTPTFAKDLALGTGLGLTTFQDDPEEQSRLASGAIGFFGTAAFKGITSGIGFLAPTRRALANVDNPQARLDEATRLSEQTGVKFNIAQATDSADAAKVLDFAKISQKGQAMAIAMEDKAVTQAFRFFKKLETSLDDGGPEFGVRMRTAFDTTSKNIHLARKAQADADFGAARAITGQTRVVPNNNSVDAIEALIKKYNTPDLADLPEVAKFLKVMNKQLETFKDTKAFSVDALQTRLQLLGNAVDGGGKSKLFSKAKAIETFSTKTLFRALKQDLDDAVKAGVPGGTQLGIARDRFAANSVVIDELKSLTLAKLFKTKTLPPPETVAKLFTSMPPSQVKAAMGMLADVDPGTHQAYQKFLLGNAMDSAQRKAAAFSSDTVRIDINEVLRVLPNDATFKAVFSDAPLRAQVMAGIRTLRKLKIGTTRVDPKLDSKTKLAAMSTNTFGNRFMAAFLAGTLTPYMYARVLFSPTGVKNLNILAKPSSSAAVVSQAFTTLQQVATGSKEEPQQGQDNVR